jgi:hypothetical protein
VFERMQDILIPEESSLPVEIYSGARQNGCINNQKLVTLIRKYHNCFIMMAGADKEVTVIKENFDTNRLVYDSSGTYLKDAFSNLSRSCYAEDNIRIEFQQLVDRAVDIMDFGIISRVDYIKWFVNMHDDIFFKMFKETCFTEYLWYSTFYLEMKKLPASHPSSYESQTGKYEYIKQMRGYEFCRKIAVSIREAVIEYYHVIYLFNFNLYFLVNLVIC